MRILRRLTGPFRVAAAAGCLSVPLATAGAGERGDSYLSPAALAAAKDGTVLFVACATGDRVLCFDAEQGKVTASIAVGGSPSGLAVSADGRTLFVTCAAPAGRVCVVDLTKHAVSSVLPAGHTPMAPVLSPNDGRLFVCNRFNNDVSVIDLKTGTQGRLPVEREPVAAAITLDGRFLLVANHLHAGAAINPWVSAVVSVLDITANKPIKGLLLPDGSGALNDIRISPDGKYAVVTHVLARFRLPATQLDRGWMNSNAMTLIDLAAMESINTVLLDDVDRGAANPWGVDWSADGGTLVVAQAGTHELSLIDFPGLLAKLARIPATLDESKPVDSTSASRVRADVPSDLAFLTGLRRRVKLPPGALGPRAVLVVKGKAYAANYFSDSLTVLDLQAQGSPPVSVPLGPRPAPSLARQGEFYFHDAGICFQGWQSCATCHPGQARVDGLNWDLLNDGIGNPKNTRSLLLAHKTPPAMSMGVRETAETAVRAGIRHILFTVQPEEVAAAIDAYLKALRPEPSPFLVNGKLSAAARRGEKIFRDRRVGCAVCHPPGLFTDQKTYDVGTRGATDQPADEFDTPTLIEVWRTAPYLHDGSAATIREVLTTRNPHDAHGKTAHLTGQQMDDLVAYVLTL